jgi:hypothetical protein
MQEREQRRRHDVRLAHRTGLTDNSAGDALARVAHRL